MESSLFNHFFIKLLCTLTLFNAISIDYMVIDIVDAVEYFVILKINDMIYYG